MQPSLLVIFTANRINSTSRRYATRTARVIRRVVERRAMPLLGGFQDRLSEIDVVLEL
jgi:hypothetical protein